MEEDRDTDGENRGREQRGNLYCPDSRIGERGLGRDDYFTHDCDYEAGDVKTLCISPDYIRGLRSPGGDDDRLPGERVDRLCGLYLCGHFYLSDVWLAGDHIGQFRDRCSFSHIKGF